MKKTFLIIFAAIFVPSLAFGGGQYFDSKWSVENGALTPKDTVVLKLPEYTVATLPDAGTVGAGSLALITDGDGGTDCTSGGGTDRVVCRSTGSAWASVDTQAAGSAEVQDEVFSSANFNADTSHGVSQDDFYDLWHGVDSDDDGSFADETWLTAYMTEAEFTTAIGADNDTQAELNAKFSAKQDASTAATDAEVAALQADDLVTLSGVAIGSTHLGTFTGTTISDNGTIKAGMQELEAAVEAAGAADAFTVKVDAGATAGYIGATYGAGAVRTDGTAITKTDGGDYVTIGAQAYLLDIAGLTLAQGDILYFDGTDVANLGPGLAGQYLKTGGAAANPSWDDPAGSGDITAVGDAASGSAFTTDGTGNVLYFEGTTANTYEIALTGANPGADVVVTIPATTGTLLLADGAGTALTALNGENIQDDTIDDDSIDFSDVTGADLTLTDAVAVTTSGAITSGGLFTANVGLTVLTGQDITLGATVWNSGDSIDGEQIADDTIDDDSIDLTDFTLADLTFDVGSVSTTEFGYLNGVTSAIQDQLDGKEATDADILRADTNDSISAIFTITGDWVNTANPWADNEVSDTITVGNAGTVDPDALSGDTTDDNLIDQDIIEGFAGSADPSVLFRDTDAAGADDADEEAGMIFSNLITATEDAEDSDMWFTIMQGGTRTTILLFDESDDRWETTKNINVPDLAYNASTWDSNNNVPTMNAIRDKFEGLSGTGTMTTVKESDSQVGGADIATLDFGAGFDVTESPDTEVQIVLDLTEHTEDTGDVNFNGTATVVEDFSLNTNADAGDNNITNIGTMSADVLQADDANLTIGGADDDVHIALDGNPDANDSYSGVTLRDLNAGEAISQWNVVYFDATDSEWKQADADAAGEFPARGIAVAAGTDGNELIVLTQGVIEETDWAWTVGGTIYLSDTPGGLTQTAPSTSGDCVQIVGWAVSADAMYVNISGHYLEVE